MFISLKTKIIFFISLVMAITTAVTMYFTYRDVGRAMLAAEESSAQNVLQLVELNIKGGYDKLLSDKMEMIVGARKQLKNVSGVCLSVLNDNAVLSEKGVLSLQDAQKRSLDWLKSVRFRKENLFVFDQNALVIVHPDPTVLGKSISVLKDMKGRHIAREMHADKLGDSGDFAVFLSKNSQQEKGSKKLGYFVPFPAWHWTVGVVLDLSEIEAQSRQKKEKIIEVLEGTFSKIQIARSGYVFLLNGKGEMLIPPRGQAQGELNLTEYVQPENLPVEDLMLAAGSKHKSMLYSEHSEAGDQLIQAHVSYFKALDWYMVVAVPEEEIHAPANALVARQSFIIGLIFLGSLTAAFFLVSKISHPLNVLAAYVKKLPVQDFIAEKDEGTPLDHLPIKYRDEVSRLAESFVIMKAELKKNIREILAAETRYRMILESIEEGFFETDLTGKWTFINDAICKMAGHSRHDLINMDIRECFTPDSLMKLHEATSRVHRTGKAAEITGCEFITKDGAQRIVELSVYLIRNASGKPSGFRGVVRDVSDRLKAKRQKKKLKARLAQAQKMEAIGTLAGGVAHDFNNILSAIFGYTELALLKDPESSDGKRHLNEVLKASQRAKELVSQILTISRQSKEELKPVEIKLIIKEALKLLRASLPATIEIRQHFETAAQFIKADPTQIHQLMMNLCTNAAAAMSAKDGVLEVSLTNVEIDTPTTTLFQDIDPGSYLKLVVSDSGHGMSPEVLEKMFDPYYTTKEKGKGTGLGLAVVHGIIERHRAAITVESTPSTGTIFHVYFPVDKQKLECTKAESVESLPAGHECILIVDDEADVVDIRTEMLTHLGYEVVPKTCSLEVLELFRTQPERFDLVITDMTMPKMTGDKLAEEILKIRPDIPIILCTGYSELINKERAKKLGIREFCLKPLGMRDLARTTRDVLDQNQC